MAKVSIDFSKTLRKMKPMHGVNNGPWTCNFTADARPLFKEAGIPVSRLHDTEYPFGSGEFVDVNCVFKNFKSDENDPENYNFALTDEYLKAIQECGTKIIYRLGCTIEHQPVKVHIHPPKDYAKWARICEHIIRHYNEGWADGYHMNIRYWEIWNEPNVASQKMWTGTMADFAEFYMVAANHLKSCFPDLMIGGPAFTVPDQPQIRDFFDIITKDGKKTPMDFYSWHGYTNTVEKALLRASQAEDVLKTYGYEDAEVVYDEWNYVKSWSNIGESYDIIQSVKGMALDAAVMAAMQSTSVNTMCYYDAQMKFAGGWCGLFKRDYSEKRANGGGTGIVPKKPFYAFKAFNELYRLGAKDTEAEIGTQHETIADQVAMKIEGEGLYGVASRSYDGTKGGFMLVNYRDFDLEQETHDVTIHLSGVPGKTMTVYILDENHDLEPVYTAESGDFDYVLEPYSVLLVTME